VCKIVNSHVRYDEVGASHIGNKQGNDLDRFTHAKRKEVLRGWLGSAYKDPPHFVLHENMKSCNAREMTTHLQLTCRLSTRSALAFSSKTDFLVGKAVRSLSDCAAVEFSWVL
jgi:hypothetical protein